MRAPIYGWRPNTPEEDVHPNMLLLKQAQDEMDTWPPTAAGVAKFLQQHQALGELQSYQNCPLVDYFTRKLGVRCQVRPMTCNDGKTYYQLTVPSPHGAWPAHYFIATTPAPVVEFVRAFDAGLHPELEGHHAPTLTTD